MGPRRVERAPQPPLQVRALASRDPCAIVPALPAPTQHVRHRRRTSRVAEVVATIDSPADWDATSADSPLRVTEFPVWRLGHTLDRLTDAHRVVVNFGRQDDHPRAMLHVRQGTSPTRPRDPSARRPDLPAPSRGGKIPEGGEIGSAFSPFCPSAPAPRPTRGVSPTRRKLAPLHRRR